MWRKIIQLKYLSIAKYYFLGIILGVIVFQFATKSMLTHEFNFGSLIEKEIIVYFVSALLGGLAGGLVYVMMIVNNKDIQIKEKTFWTNLKKKNTSFFIRNIVALSLGGFVYKLTQNLIDLTSYENLFQALFTKRFVIDYIGIILAMTVFSIVLSIGIKKRLNLLYGNPE